MGVALRGRDQTVDDEVEREISGRLAVLGLAVVCWLTLALFAYFFFAMVSVDGNELRAGRRAAFALMVV